LARTFARFAEKRREKQQHAFALINLAPNRQISVSPLSTDTNNEIMSRDTN
jgi:hypothetical protein